MDERQIPDGWEVPSRKTMPGDRQHSRPPATGPLNGSHQDVSAALGPPSQSEADRIRQLCATASRVRAIVSILEHDVINGTCSLPVPLSTAMQAIMVAVYTLAGEHPDVATLKDTRSDNSDGQNPSSP